MGELIFKLSRPTKKLAPPLVLSLLALMTACCCPRKPIPQTTAVARPTAAPPPNLTTNSILHFGESQARALAESVIAKGYLPQLEDWARGLLLQQRKTDEDFRPVDNLPDFVLKLDPPHGQPTACVWIRQEGFGDGVQLVWFGQSQMWGLIFSPPGSQPKFSWLNIAEVRPGMFAYWVLEPTPLPKHRGAQQSP